MMRHESFLNGPPISAGVNLLVIVGLFGLLCLIGGLLALVSRTWRTRLGQIALHALWIIPVLGLFTAAISWRVHQARTPVVSSPQVSSPTLTVPATRWPDIDGTLHLPRTETFRVPTTTIHYSVSPHWGLIALIGIGAVLAGGMAWRAMRRHAATMIPVAGVVAALAIVCAGLVASFAVHERRIEQARYSADVRIEAARDAAHKQQLAVMQARQAARSTEPRPSQVLDYRGIPTGEEAAETSSVSVPSIDNSRGSEIVAYVGSIPTAEPLRELPDWVRDALSGDDDHDAPTRVYASDPWVTTEEADQELLRKVAPELERYFWSEYPAAAGWSPSPELIAQSGAVARRCYQTVPWQFGEHQETMHKAYWQVDRKPEVARFFFDHWRPLAVQQRLIWAAAAVGLLTLIFGSLGAYFRLNAATSGRYRGRLKFATGAVCVAGGLAAILLA